MPLAVEIHSVEATFPVQVWDEWIRVHISELRVQSEGFGSLVVWLKPHFQDRFGHGIQILGFRFGFLVAARSERQGDGERTRNGERERERERESESTNLSRKPLFQFPKFPMMHRCIHRLEQLRSARPDSTTRSRFFFPGSIRLAGFEPRQKSE